MVTVQSKTFQTELGHLSLGTLFDTFFKFVMNNVLIGQSYQNVSMAKMFFFLDQEVGIDFVLVAYQ